MLRYPSVSRTVEREGAIEKRSDRWAGRSRLVVVLAFVASVLTFGVGGSVSPAWGCSGANHCFAVGEYNALHRGVSSDVEIFNHPIWSGFTANFVTAWWNANNWMNAGYVDGDAVEGNTSVPRGFVDWKNGGSYDHTGLLCSPNSGTLQDTRVRNTDNGWVGTVCSNLQNPNPGLGTDHAIPEGETEITNNANGCGGHYENLKDFESGNWSLWNDITKFRSPDDSSDPLAISIISNHAFRTSCP